MRLCHLSAAFEEVVNANVNIISVSRSIPTRKTNSSLHSKMARQSGVSPALAIG